MGDAKVALRRLKAVASSLANHQEFGFQWFKGAGVCYHHLRTVEIMCAFKFFAEHPPFGDNELASKIAILANFIFRWPSWICGWRHHRLVYWSPLCQNKRKKLPIINGDGRSTGAVAFQTILWGPFYLSDDLGKKKFEVRALLKPQFQYNIKVKLQLIWWSL